MTRFHTASEVKRFLKEKEFAEKVSVKRRTNPFSGNPSFFVSLPRLAGVNTLYAGGSQMPSTFGALPGANDAEREKADALNRLNTVLKGTNAHAE